MNLTALVLMTTAFGVGQPVPVPTDVKVTKQTRWELPVKIDPANAKDLVKLQLLVSRDDGQTYTVHHEITPAQTGFTFAAKEDGLHLLQMVQVFKDGSTFPREPLKAPPSERLVVDTTPPKVTVTTAEMNGDELVVEWAIEDKHPADATTKVFYGPISNLDSKGRPEWKEAPPGSIKKRTARFKPESSGPLLVQVATADLATNIGAANREVSTKGVATPTGGMVPVAGIGSPTDVTPPVMPPVGASAPSGPLPPPSLVEPPSGTPAPIPPVTTPPAAPPVPPVIGGVAVLPGGSPAPLVAPAADSGAGKPIASGSGIGGVPPATAALPAPTSPSVVAEDRPQVPAIRSPRFDLNYQLEGGPSGVARVDLYVTRDDGRTWVRWSTHDGRESPLRVALDTRLNRDLEGEYGFRLVPVSGAGLSEGAPTPGTAPDSRVLVDVTPPMITVYAPTPDPNNRNALLLHWDATDKNFGKDPMLIEYSETATGPWKAVASAETVVPAGATTATNNRVANTGSLSWQPPAGLASPKVYLRFTAWDTAGNKSEVTTPQPVLIDLTKPKAKIQGIVPSVAR